MSFKPVLALAAATALVAGCAVDPYANTNRTQQGAVAGAIAGGVLGAATGSGNRLPEALLGAGIGAVAGGVVGASLDRQAAELRAQLGNEIDVRNTGNEIVVTMAQDILFATDSATLRADLRSDLRAIAANLQRYPDSTIIVTGHTDSTGAMAYNQSLSERRADSVAAVLIESGVSSRRVVARGAGQTQPVASNDTAAGRAQNRRVEIVIRPTN
ncbi:OmpA family protein [Pararhodobacter sp.]|jgi:outer membrane protein OmpA-like peptidoglycan-associated protein|uniref:OmpA family protein n=1 Tax=Pararhodobacter sp. TaxID=2127056 RepID=UPI002FDD3A3E